MWPGALSAPRAVAPTLLPERLSLPMPRLDRGGGSACRTSLRGPDRRSSDALVTGHAGYREVGGCPLCVGIEHCVEERPGVLPAEPDPNSTNYSPQRFRGTISTHSYTLPEP